MRKAPRLFINLSESLPISAMKPVATIRRANLDLLVSEIGTMEKVAEVAGTSPVYLSQIKNQTLDQKTGKPRQMGGTIARRIELKLGKPDGWMDADHSSQAAEIKADQSPTLGLTTGHALSTLDALLTKLPPLVQQAGRDTLKKWAQGEATIEQTEAVLQALAEAGSKLPPLGHALLDTPVRNNATKT